MDILQKILDHTDSSAGGGSASALAGAMAGALLAMVAPFSGYSPGSEVEERGKALSGRLFAGSQEDTASFQAVRNAFRLPKSSDEEKAVRLRAIQAAWALATRTPLENAERCLAVLELAAELQPTVNAKVLSDYSSGVYLAKAGLLGCLDNVAINLPSIKDAGLVESLSARAAAARSRGDALVAALGLPAAPAFSSSNNPTGGASS